MPGYETSMDWLKIIEASFIPQGSLEVNVGPIPLILLGLFLVIKLIRAIRHIALARGSWSVVEINVKLAGITDIKIKPNHEIARIAHQAWTELVTSKVSLPFEPENDVIVEVYDSWYKIFTEIRLLIRSIPAEQLRSSEDSRKLVGLLVTVLNEGLRPHLTKWQARFRIWYDREFMNEEVKFPQDIQKLYPQYQELEADLIKANQLMIEFANELKKLAQGEK